MKIKAAMAARVLRWLVLAASVAFFLFFSGFISEHAICPVGGFEMFFTGLFKTGFTMAGLLSGMVLVFLSMSLLSILLRRAYCGYLCPMGALQELFERLGQLVLPRKLRGARLPAALDRALRWGKYLVLAAFVAGAALGAGHWMIPGDPFMAFMGLSKAGGLASVAGRLPFALGFFAAILAYAFFLGRGFCKYLCPAGAWYSLLAKLSPNKVVRNEEACAGCGRCSKACPMGIDVAHSKAVRSAECIGCRECVNACPKKGALSAPIGRVDVPAALLPLAAAAVFSGSLYLAAASMPARGARPSGGGGGEQGPGLRKGDPSPGERKKVGLGGCPDCVGCGLCGAAAKA